MTALAVHVRTVGMMPDPPVITWPEGWPPPREGETVWGVGEPMYVRSVSWYPQGNGEEEGEATIWAQPHVYVVVGPRRPT